MERKAGVALVSSSAASPKKRPQLTHSFVLHYLAQVSRWPADAMGHSHVQALIQTLLTHAPSLGSLSCPVCHLGTVHPLCTLGCPLPCPCTPSLAQTGDSSAKAPPHILPMEDPTFPPQEPRGTHLCSQVQGCDNDAIDEEDSI